MLVIDKKIYLLKILCLKLSYAVDEILVRENVCSLLEK